MIHKSLETIEKYTKETSESATKYSKNAFQKYPLLFSLLVLFGVVATSKGFEMIIEEFSIFENNPSILFLIGIFILLSTGTFYKIIEKNKN